VDLASFGSMGNVIVDLQDYITNTGFLWDTAQALTNIKIIDSDDTSRFIEVPLYLKMCKIDETDLTLYKEFFKFYVGQSGEVLLPKFHSGDAGCM
jgi:hypothetical protein